ncbi:hypothetical protein BO78DRAFT_415794 [Aspergillus sclerotiicarbonarius CBS 121057]|uniref:Uncharacterized protein n=1 Tax=Aspergillus sclerotiicarbonarius (strain CBS 121057 / IBT 28362) TaxID=1448318 RepID=A0A319EJ97_ASPSB|nr:hypothetical protein BO78DRAFT_415794 [Aspergillus sclerotiicarbonarius CBS 121057]
MPPPASKWPNLAALGENSAHLQERAMNLQHDVNVLLGYLEANAGIKVSKPVVDHSRRSRRRTAVLRRVSWNLVDQIKHVREADVWGDLDHIPVETELAMTFTPRESM